jgi:predicted Ser/Thr protein kinase
MMAETKICPKCRAELPDNAPSGICPKCLMQAGLESEQEVASASQMNPTTPWSGFVPPQPDDLAKFFPQLEILELLGKGGMGAVYKARQPGLERLVAVKILPPEFGTDPAFAERFTREARALASLNHQNIVSIFDFGQVDGQYYFIMEYVDGANLRHVIKTGTIKPEEALALVPQICEALQFAHDEGVVHRDIKPENILIDKRGRLKIADFGLAKLATRSPEEWTLTGTHQVMGSPRYMAPEQMEGSHAVDHRADIYSLGVVFYEMLTGEVPAGHFEPPSKKVEVDVRLDEVVLRAMAREPERRYQHASDVKTDVENVLTTTSAAPPSPQQSSDLKVGSGDTLFSAAQPPAADFKSVVRSQFKVPAIGILVAGIVDLLAAATIVLLVVLVGSGYSVPGINGLETGGNMDFADTVFVLVVALVSLMAGIVLVLGAARMFDLQSYGIALIAAVVAILPCAPGFPISLPFGIWALIVVLRHDVKTAFADEDAKSEREQNTPESNSVMGLTIAFGVSFGAVLGAAMNNIGVFLSLGLVLGILVGSVIDTNNRRKTKD